MTRGECQGTIRADGWDGLHYNTPTTGTCQLCGQSVMAEDESGDEIIWEKHYTNGGIPMTLIERVKAAIKDGKFTNELIHEAMGEESDPHSLYDTLYLTDWNIIMPEAIKRKIDLYVTRSMIEGHLLEPIGWKSLRYADGKGTPDYSPNVSDPARALWAAILADKIEKGEIK